MNQQDIDAHLLSDDEFEALEELLVSDVVPEDCMDLEMLDGFLAAVVVSPVPIEPADWLPVVWSAHGEEVSFGSGRQVQQVIRLVLRYYNELAVSIGAEEGWEPFCFAAGEGDTLAIGEEWMAGFTQGLELWPQDWEAGVADEQAGAVREEIAAMAATWGSPAADSADEETRLLWLEEAGEAVARIRARWREGGLPLAGPVAVDAPAAARPAGPGRNEPCSCGSGKKYKKCCGAEN